MIQYFMNCGVLGKGADMLNKERVGLMTKLARYEKREDRLTEEFFCFHNCLYSYSGSDFRVPDGGTHG